ncbi:hypothetical protein PMKS-001272 [Pichia membranifaciens]|uniref:Maintenance of telomere capping protein 1 n=1 Tax=Pichia membranifaciens TaxID=4926 RepID=A0A1Q2YE57_9ASCO|nr:hypothetical protein PMKS-001272 [Pichia membranifaciens]
MTSATDEKEIFDFLDSLPTDDASSANVDAAASAAAAAKSSGSGATQPADKSVIGADGKKTDDDIFEFLDELEGKNKGSGKKKETDTKGNGSNDNNKGESGLESSNETIRDDEKTGVKGAEGERKTFTSVEPPLRTDEPVNDPITSIASWWSSTGSAKVSTQLSSLWGTAQSIGEQAQKQAEDALKKAREQSLEDNIRTAVKELGISGVRDNINEMLTEEQRAELMKLPVPDAKKALESLNSGLNMGFSFVGGTLNEVVERINAMNNKDEVIEIILVHDMKNFIGLTDMVKYNFEDVMSQQVDGSIDVNIYSGGMIRSSQEGQAKLDSIAADDGVIHTSEERINFALFNGKGSDAEKLIMANIENEMKRRTMREDPANESSTTDSSPSSPASSNLGNADTEFSESEDAVKTRKTVIYISLLAWTSNKDNTLNNGKEIVIDSHSSSSFTISCVLKDEAHGITIHSQSQPLPLKWAQWIEGNLEEREKEDDIDPSEWVFGWVKNAISNAIGVTSQSYIIKRMGY